MASQVNPIRFWPVSDGGGPSTARAIGASRSAAGDELPAGEGCERDRASPVLGEDDAGCHRQCAGESGEDSDGVERGAGSQDQQPDPDDAEHAGGRGGAAESFARERGRQSCGDERLDRAEGGGDAAGESVGGDEQQHEEGADVEHAEHGCLPPP